MTEARLERTLALLELHTLADRVLCVVQAALDQTPPPRPDLLARLEAAAAGLRQVRGTTTAQEIAAILALALESAPVEIN